ncbi:MAG: acyltransferase family protein [Sedimentisphaerales bacterium]|nr:acyltransferase family protein [Sedimentisphaerales bacterium]
MERARLFFIDNLRILLITLVIMEHLSITYGGPGSWYYKEIEPDKISFIVLSWHNATNQAYFMGFLFLIAGYFTPGSYDRKGPRRFFKDRLLRMGIPMLCYDFVIGPLVAYPLIRTGAWKTSSSYRDYLARYYTRFHVGTGPLWFVETLLIFAIFYMLWRRFSRPVTPPAPNKGDIPSNWLIAVFALVVGTITFTVRIWLPVGWAFGPLNLQFPFFPQYICMFIVGIHAYRNNWFLRLPDGMGRFWLCVAVVFIAIGFPALFMFGGAATGNTDPFIGGLHWQCLAYSIWEQFVCVAVVIGLLVLFRKRFNRQGTIVKAMSDSSYTAYIIHAPVIILFTLAVRSVTLYPLLKFAVVVPIAVALSFALANVIRQLPLARKIL